MKLSLILCIFNEKKKKVNVKIFPWFNFCSFASFYSESLCMYLVAKDVYVGGCDELVLYCWINLRSGVGYGSGSFKFHRVGMRWLLHRGRYNSKGFANTNVHPHVCACLFGLN